jgi:hypothetical protein
MQYAFYGVVAGLVMLLLYWMFRKAPTRQELLRKYALLLVGCRHNVYDMMMNQVARMTEEQFHRRLSLAANEQRLEPFVDRWLDVMAYIFQEMTYMELLQAVQFFESPAGQKHLASGKQDIEEVLGRQMHEQFSLIANDLKTVLMAA